MPLEKYTLGRWFLAIQRPFAITILAVFLFTFMGGGRIFYGEAPARAKVGRARADMRALASALDAYFADHGAYPGSRPLGDFAPEPGLLSGTGATGLSGVDPGRAGGLSGGSASGPASGPAGLTTPVAYVAALPLDPFTGRKTRIPMLTTQRATWPLAYHRAAGPEPGWLLWSPGPDGVYDILDPSALYVPGEARIRVALLQRIYDPTNGIFSSGDVVSWDQGVGR